MDCHRHSQEQQEQSILASAKPVPAATLANIVPPVSMWVWIVRKCAARQTSRCKYVYNAGEKVLNALRDDVVSDENIQQLTNAWIYCVAPLGNIPLKQDYGKGEGVQNDSRERTRSLFSVQIKLKVVRYVFFSRDLIPSYIGPKPDHPQCSVARNAQTDYLLAHGRL